MSMFCFTKKRIGIIGFGNMGSAIAERIKSKYQVFVFDKDKNKTNNLSGIKVAQSSVDLVNQVDTVILAVKPQDFDGVLEEIKGNVDKKLIISIAAGKRTDYIEEMLGRVRVVRVMPNMPAKIGKGVSCLCKGKFVTYQDFNFALKLFKLFGITLILNEDMMNAATAISGSGPGFWGYRIENEPKSEWKNYSYNVFMPEFFSAAQSLGFTKKEAKLLVETTIKGSLATVEAWNTTPSELKKQVTSKGGTTEAGLEVLHRGGSLEEAVKAALKRAEELSRKE